MITSYIKFANKCAAALCLLVGLAGAGLSHAAEPLKIGYNDWPGWIGWEVAIEKQWFEDMWRQSAKSFAQVTRQVVDQGYRSQYQQQKRRHLTVVQNTK